MNMKNKVLLIILTISVSTVMLAEDKITFEKTNKKDKSKVKIEKVVIDESITNNKIKNLNLNLKYQTKQNNKNKRNIKLDI